MRGLEALLTRQKTVAAGVVVGLVLLGGALYPSLPDPMAVHWNASGGGWTALPRSRLRSS